MKKINVLLCAFLLGVFSLFSVSATGEKEAAPGTGEITIWTDMAVSSDVFTKAIAGFTAKYPNCKVNFEMFPGADRAQKLALAKASKTLPALFFTGSFTIMDEAHQGSLLPVTDLVLPVKADILPSALEPVFVNNHYYMLPVFTSTFGMLYNADILKAAGLGDLVPANKYQIANFNLDTFENRILPALKKYFDGTEKYATGLFSGNDQADTHTLNLLRMLGGYVIKDGKVVAADDAETIAALEKLKSWIDKGYTNSNAVTKLATEVTTDFQNQKVGISFGQYTNYTSITNLMTSGKIPAFDLRIAAVPGKEENILASYIYGAVMMNVNKSQQQVAKIFMEYLLGEGKSYMEGIAKAGLPAFVSVNTELAKTNPLLGEYAKNDKLIYDFTGRAPGYVSTRKYFFPALQSVFSGGIGAKAALTSYQEQAGKVINEFTSRSFILNKK